MKKRHKFKKIPRESFHYKDKFICEKCEYEWHTYSKVTPKEAEDYVFKYYKSCK